MKLRNPYDHKRERRGPGADADGTKEDLNLHEVKWGMLPEGLVPASKPSVLDDSLVGSLIYMRWGSSARLVP